MRVVDFVFRLAETTCNRKSSDIEDERLQNQQIAVSASCVNATMQERSPDNLEEFTKKLVAVYGIKASQCLDVMKSDCPVIFHMLIQVFISIYLFEEATPNKQCRQN